MDRHRLKDQIVVKVHRGLHADIMHNSAIPSNPPVLYVSPSWYGMRASEGSLSRRLSRLSCSDGMVALSILVHTVSYLDTDEQRKRDVARR